MSSLSLEFDKVECKLVWVGGRSHRDVQPSLQQANDEFLCVDLCLGFDDHEGLYGLLQASHCFDKFLPGIKLSNLSFELF